MVFKFTKIVATIGPSSRNEEVIRGIITGGADVVRLNFSHGTFDDHLLSVSLVRKVAKELDKPIAIFQDLQGPKIRVGKLSAEFIELIEGEEFILTTDDIAGGLINGVKKVSIDYTNLHKEAKEGDRILLDDGLFELKVVKIAGTDIYTRVINGGNLKPHKGVNFPHVKLKISAVTEKDKSDLKFAFDNDLDYVALSFVRHADDVKELTELMLKTHGRKIPIIAKIEKPEAIHDIDNIIDAADAIMVARGDLGVETSPQEVPIMQKNIIRKCNIKGKPVITATQMLESMVSNPRPTRAEANDVANAILDGTDAVMLSSETAAGKYPVEAVNMMNSIALQVESSSIFKRIMPTKNMTSKELKKHLKENTEEAVSYATIQLADKIDAKFIVTFTQGGKTALSISKFRSVIPTIAISPMKAIIRRLALVWGITPFELGSVSTVEEMLDGASEVLKFKELVNEGDYVVVTAGVPIGVSGSTNMIKVVKI